MKKTEENVEQEEKGHLGGRGHTRELGHSEPGTKLSSSLGQEGCGYKFIYLFMTQSHTVAQTGLELTM